MENGGGPYEFKRKEANREYTNPFQVSRFPICVFYGSFKYQHEQANGSTIIK